jgi:hypothetical protein
MSPGSSWLRKRLPLIVRFNSKVRSRKFPADAAVCGQPAWLSALVRVGVVRDRLTWDGMVAGTFMDRSPGFATSVRGDGAGVGGTSASAERALAISRSRAGVACWYDPDDLRRLSSQLPTPVVIRRI